jgi:signal transduction histidine kinase
LLAFWRNVTAQRLTEQQVNKQTAALREIAWVQSHIVRAPVAHILGLISIFNRANPADPFNQEVLDLLATAGRNLDAVIHDVVGKAHEV